MYKKVLSNDLKSKKEELENDIAQIDLRLPRYRKGSLFKQNNYYYIKRYENRKTISTYLGKDLTIDEINNVTRELQNRKTLERRKKDLQKELNEIIKLIKRYGE